jgi:hypothetical protein
MIAIDLLFVRMLFLGRKSIQHQLFESLARARAGEPSAFCNRRLDRMRGVRVGHGPAFVLYNEGPNLFCTLLGHPVYAIPVVLCAFLFFAGLGSGFAPSLTARLDALQRLSRPGALMRFIGGDGRVRHPALALAVAGIVAAAALHLVAAPPMFRWLMPLPDALKIVVSLVLIAPLAFSMGLPFPLALVRVAATRPGFVPWAWGINGCASVLSAVLAILLAMSLGFSAVLLIAIGLYLLAAATLR